MGWARRLRRLLQVQVNGTCALNLIYGTPWSESRTTLFQILLGSFPRAHFRRIWRFDQYKTLDSTNIHIGRILYWSYPRPAYIQCTLDSAFEALAQIGQPRRTAFQQGNLTPKSGRHDDSRIQIFYAVHIALFFLFLFLFSLPPFFHFSFFLKTPGLVHN